MIIISKAQEKGNIVYPDPQPHSIFPNILNNNRTRILAPKDIPIETFKQIKVQNRFAQKTPQPPVSPLINKLNTINDTLKLFNDNASLETIQTEIIANGENKTEEKNSLLKILISLAPYISIICFVPVVCFITWIIYNKCQRNVPSRNAIKTFSHKIINNNKSESIETSTSSFSGETDFNAMFRKYQETNAGNNCLNIMAAGGHNEWEFPRHHLRFMHILGQGCFGQVWKCEAFNIGNTSTTQIVAVKTLKENASKKEKRDLLAELEVMKVLDPHPNVVTLIGCCTERDPVYLIMEYVPFGKLQKYLNDSREDLNYGNFYGNEKLNSRDLISFAYQIAKGMEYLSSKEASTGFVFSLSLKFKIN